MILTLTLKNSLAKFAFCLAVVCAASAACYGVVCNFIIVTLADDRAALNADVLDSAIDHFPSSPRLRARLAERLLSGHSGSDGTGRDLTGAEHHALTAVNLSPLDHRYRVLLASIQEAHGDRASAEASLREALVLASNYTTVHWRLANLLLRSGKLDESIESFRAAVSADDTLLPVTLDLLWRGSAGDQSKLISVTGNDPKARLTLARFLLHNSNVNEAVEVGRSVNGEEWSAETAQFVAALISSGNLNAARNYWIGLAGRPDPGLVWNGGFESDPSRALSHFDWKVVKSRYARFSLDNESCRSGARSLRIDFAGHDTTRLEAEVKQLVVLRPATGYRLEFYARARDLVTPEGPRFVLLNRGKVLAASEPISSNASDWKRFEVDFDTPQTANGDVCGLEVALYRTPRFSYDEPTRGTVWLDDFSITERRATNYVD